MNDVREFVNPYHFISTKDSACKRSNPFDKSTEDEKRFTGYIDFTIETKTPLFIPNTNKLDRKDEDEGKDKHEALEFFTYNEKDERDTYKNNEPIIPGSSIRGMLRNIYETITDSCLSVIDDESILYKRTNDYYSHGLLKINKSTGQIDLYSCNHNIIDRRDIDTKKYKEGCRVNVETYKDREGKERVKSIAPFNNTKKKTGYIIKGENGPEIKGKTKHNVHIFFEGSGVSIKKDIYIKGLLDVLDSYADDKINKNIKKGNHRGYKEYKKELEKFLKGEGNDYFPVYYSEISFKNSSEKIYYLSPACITKEVYYNSINDLLTHHGNYAPCVKINNLCPACELFGMVGENDENNKDSESISSLIRVDDGRLINEENKPLESLYHEQVTLQELSSPKISSTEFYLQKQVGADFWTYDYYVENGQLYKYFPKIAGRKYYWHHPKVKLVDCEKTDRNKTVRPLKAKTKFRTKLYFDKITEKQLKELIWICNISKNEDLGYKLGMGKPIGLGSVKLNVEAVKIRSFVKNNILGYYIDDYQSDYNYGYDELGFSKVVKEAFLVMCDFNSLVEKTVCYPISKGQSPEPDKFEKGYEWFTNNRYKKGKGNGKIATRKEMELDQYLEVLDDKVQTLVPNKKGAPKVNGGEVAYNPKGSSGKNGNNYKQTKTISAEDRTAPEFETGQEVTATIKEINGKNVIVEINKQRYILDIKKNKNFKPQKNKKIKFVVKSKKIKLNDLSTIEGKDIAYV